MLDAISTALFSMSPETLDTWLDNHQSTLNLEMIQFNYDAIIVAHMITTVFEENAS
jgi:hypothetical protein